MDDERDPDALALDILGDWLDARAGNLDDRTIWEIDPEAGERILDKLDRLAESLPDE